METLDSCSGIFWPRHFIASQIQHSWFTLTLLCCSFAPRFLCLERLDIKNSFCSASTHQKISHIREVNTPNVSNHVSVLYCCCLLLLFPCLQCFETCFVLRLTWLHRHVSKGRNTTNRLWIPLQMFVHRHNNASLTLEFSLYIASPVDLYESMQSYYVSLIHFWRQTEVSEMQLHWETSMWCDNCSSGYDNVWISWKSLFHLFF